MILRIKKQAIEYFAYVSLIIGLMVSLFAGVGVTGQFVSGANITNNTVLAIVNVTNTEPNITSIRIDDDDPTPANEIDLIPSYTKIVTCNATVFDYNGFADVSNGNSNATLFIQSVGVEADDDNNDHYTNTSCRCRQAAGASEIDFGDTSNNAVCDCRFAVEYYANHSGNWMCQFTVEDNGGVQVEALKINLTDTLNSSTVTVNKLLAINTTEILDYGNLSVTETSQEISHNVTNVGNTEFNLTLRGYGGTNESTGQNFSMLCQFGNMSFGTQRYTFGQFNGTAYGDMRNLTNQTIPLNFTIPQRVDDSTLGISRNFTFWKLQVPLSVGGICNGTIIFGAVETA